MYNNPNNEAIYQLASESTLINGLDNIIQNQIIINAGMKGELAEIKNKLYSDGRMKRRSLVSTELHFETIQVKLIKNYDYGNPEVVPFM